jgi:hypothetical protein
MHCKRCCRCYCLLSLLQFYKCIREISDNPTSETMSKWLDHPTIGPLVGAMWKSMQIARNRGQ